MQGAHLERGEVLGIELVVVGERILPADEVKVLYADDHTAARPHTARDGGLGMQLACVLQGFVIVAESRYHHHVQTRVEGIDVDIEVAHHITRKVVLGQGEEQLVLIDRVGRIDQEECEVGIAFGRERLDVGRILAVEHSRAPLPYVAHLKLAAVETASGFHAIDDHAGHLAHLALGILADERIHIGETPFGIAAVESAQTADEDKLVAVGPQRETGFRHPHVARHLAIAVSLECLVGSGVEGVFYMLAKLRVLAEIRIGEQCGPRTLRILTAQFVDIGVSDGRLSLERIEQEEMIVGIGHLLKVGIVVGEAAECLLALGQIAQFVLEDDTRVVKALLQQLVAGGQLLGREWYLRQIIFTFVGIVLRTVGNGSDRVGHLFSPDNRVALFVGPLLRTLSAHGNDGLVDTLPVVDILTASPEFLEVGLSLGHSHRIVEVPQPLRVVGRIGGGVRIVAVARIVTTILGDGSGRILFGLQPALLTLLLFERLDDTVDGGVAVFLAHGGQRLEGVLQVYGLGEGHQFVEHLRPVGELLVVLAVFVEHADGRPVAPLGIGVLLAVPVEIAETEQQHTLLYAAAGRLGIALLVGGDGVERVFLIEVDIADGVVYLVEVVLVLVTGGHPLEPPYHLVRLSARHHLGHGDTGIELKVVGRVLTDDVAVGTQRFGLVAEGCLQLSHEIPLAGPLLAAHLVLDDLAQIGHGLGIVAGVYIVVGEGEVPLFLGLPSDGVAAHVADDILGIVEPALFHIALGQPRTRLGIDGGLRTVEAAHVREGGSGIVECALMKLRAPHEHPRFPQEGIVLAAREPLDVLLGLATLLRPLRPALDTVQFDGFLTLLDGPVEIGLAQFAAALVAYGVEGNEFGEVVLIAVFFLQRTVDVGQRTVVVGIVTGIEGVPPTGLGGILLRGTSYGREYDGRKSKEDDMSCIMQLHVYKTCQRPFLLPLRGHK